ncbi:MAG: DinB family protein [Phycisphaerales bacterium]|nr:DinB family protein [Phycisphaerales bacterium]
MTANTKEEFVMNTGDRWISIMLESTAWATGALLESCAALSPEQFHQRFEIGPGSVHDTLRHVIGAMLRWADRIGGAPLRPSIEVAGQNSPLAEQREHLAMAVRDLRAAADRVSAAGTWHESIEFAVPGGATYRFSRAAALVHVVTHGVHHRAQVMNMRRQLGLASLELDLDPVEWECVTTGQIPSPSPSQS